MVRSDIAIITAYNDMLSAHQPYEHYPQRLKQALQAVGAVGRGRRRAGDVRRRDAGAGRHGAVADEPRRDRHVGRRRPVAQHVRRCAVPRHLRQDRARAGDGRPLLRPPARAVRACRPDEQRFTQQRKGARAPAVRRGQGRPPGAAGSRGRVLSRHRHLHLLRHRQHQPNGDGSDGPAPAGRLLRTSGHAAARRAERRRRAR